MRAIWGDMALAMLRKRLRDVRADRSTLTEDDLALARQIGKSRSHVANTPDAAVRHRG